MTERTLKPGWKVWRFDHIATSVADRVEPGDVDVDYYVGLKHLDPDSLKIRRWGKPSDVKATKLLFCKGDIIFGRRRVYQRKLAVAEFDGICSAHAMVLRPKTDVVLPDFLPFFMQSDLFMQRALEISVGSLSPTINWRTLAKQEFALPPLAEQRRIAEVLAASLTVVDSFREALESIKTCERAFLDESVIRWKSSVRWVNLAEVLDGSPESGCSAPSRDNPTGHWVLALNALSHLGYTGGQLKPVDRTDKMVAALLHQGDLLISRSNTRDRVGFVGIYNGESEGDVSFPDTMMRLNPREKVISNVFLEFVLQSTPLRRRIMSIAAGTSASMKKINRQNLLKIKVPVPLVTQQHRAVEMRHQLRHRIECMDNRFSQAIKLHRQLLAHLLTL